MTQELSDEGLMKLSRSIAHRHCDYPGGCELSDACHETLSGEISLALKQVRRETREEDAKLMDKMTSQSNFCECYDNGDKLGTAIRALEGR